MTDDERIRTMQISIEASECLGEKEVSFSTRWMRILLDRALSRQSPEGKCGHDCGTFWTQQHEDNPDEEVEKTECAKCPFCPTSAPAKEDYLLALERVAELIRPMAYAHERERIDIASVKDKYCEWCKVYDAITKIKKRGENAS